MSAVKSDYIEEAVCNLSDIDENEMKEFEIYKKYKILLIRQNSNVRAIGTKCSHYGASLANGVLGDGRVRCPWHGASFNIKTGDIEDLPGLDSIPCYNVYIKNEKIYVNAKKSDLEKKRRIKPMVKHNPSNKKLYVIIGGGTAGGVCAETLRQDGFTGRIVIICREYALPYDRVKVSKVMDITLDQLEFRKPEFYAQHSIEIMLGVSATKLITKKKIINCSNGDQIQYDKVFIATGADPIILPIPEANHLENVMTIRNHVDAQKITKLLTKEINIVFLGSSFLSLEAASYCIKKVKSVTIVFRGDALLKKVFGKDIGFQLIKLFEDNGVNMISQNEIRKCNGIKGKINSVELRTGEKIACDLLIMCVGARPCTDFLKDSDIPINGFGSINTDLHLRVINYDDVFVGGDIANAPILVNNNDKATIAHYQIAQYHGKIAAANMAGKKTELCVVPFFWTQLFGKSFRYAGYGKSYEMAIKGKIETFDFAVFYMDVHGNVNAVASCNRDPVVSQFAEFLKQGRKLHKNDITKSTYGWVKTLNH